MASVKAFVPSDPFVRSARARAYHQPGNAMSVNLFSRASVGRDSKKDQRSRSQSDIPAFIANESRWNRDPCGSDQGSSE